MEEYSDDRMRLRAEMRVPGRAWLEFHIRESSAGGRELVQTAYYEPGSLWGKLYWYLLVPFHFFIFQGMAHGIMRWADQQAAIQHSSVVSL